MLVVVGYQQASVRDSVGSWARFVTNERFAETNSMYSFLLGERVLDDDLLVMNSDIFCDPRMFQVLLAADGDALLYDASSGDEDEQMKVHVRDSVLVEMSKALPPGRVSGENVGILRLSRETAESAAAAAAALIAAGHDRAWLAEAINVTAADAPDQLPRHRGVAVGRDRLPRGPRPGARGGLPEGGCRTGAARR